MSATKSNKKPFAGKRAKAAEMLTNPEFSGSVADICRTVGVARSTFYRWMKEPDYLEYLQELIDSFTDSELASVWKALIAECKTGNVQAIKLYFELKGKYSLKIEVSEKLADVFAQMSGGEELVD